MLNLKSQIQVGKFISKLEKEIEKLTNENNRLKKENIELQIENGKLIENLHHNQKI